MYFMSVDGPFRRIRRTIASTSTVSASRSNDDLLGFIQRPTFMNDVELLHEECMSGCPLALSTMIGFMHVVHNGLTQLSSVDAVTYSSGHPRRVNHSLLQKSTVADVRKLTSPYEYNGWKPLKTTTIENKELELNKVHQKDIDYWEQMAVREGTHFIFVLRLKAIIDSIGGAHYLPHSHCNLALTIIEYLTKITNQGWYPGVSARTFQITNEPELSKDARIDALYNLVGLYISAVPHPDES